MKTVNEKEFVKIIIDIIERIEDKGNVRKFLEFIRDYQIVNRKIVDEIALSYGLKYHKECNSYWWV